MAIHRFEKEPWESYLISGDFQNVIEDSGESIVLGSSTVTAVDKDGTDASADILDGAPSTLGDYLTIRVKEGTLANSPYEITFRITTTLGNKWEMDVEMVMID